MADFTSGFWNWFIIIPVVAGIIAMFVLNRWMTEPRRKQDAKAKPMGHVWDEDLQELNNPLPKWWLNMFYVTLVFGIGYLILYPGLGNYAGAFGWSQKGQYESEVANADKQFNPLYEQYLKEGLAVRRRSAGHQGLDHAGPHRRHAPVGRGAGTGRHGQRGRIRALAQRPQRERGRGRPRQGEIPAAVRGLPRRRRQGQPGPGRAQPDR
jgi:hypothetical protein